ncbi:MAG: glycerol-3-phosphate acyltransferase [Bacteroidetes bacterium]|nr:glycerol-3-phosphate acyltransferase [Bacteroidota bacterium]
MDYVLYFVGGYLIGSIPSAYIIAKIKAGIDIRKMGSGNVGAYNVYDSTKSRSAAILVGILDAMKGFIVTYGVWKFCTLDIWAQVLAFLGTIIGHNYPLWLKFKGGRGLATAAGGYIAIGFPHIVVWCLLWVVAYRFSRKILRANLYAILLSPLVILILPSSMIAPYLIRDMEVIDYRLLVYIVSTFHLLSHLDEIKRNFLPQRTE